MHYEGDLYPECVPITNWQEYDIEKMHPDVILTVRLANSMILKPI